MTKTEVFSTIKEANKLVELMGAYNTNSREYDDLNYALGLLLDSLMYDKRRAFTLHMSKNGKYFVKY